MSARIARLLYRGSVFVKDADPQRVEGALCGPGLAHSSEGGANLFPGSTGRRPGYSTRSCFLQKSTCNLVESHNLNSYGNMC